MRTVYVASGITSSLFNSLRPLLNDVTIYATVREGSKFVDPDILLVQSIYEIPNLPDCALWLSTHTDVAILSDLVSKIPTLFISSAGIMSYLKGQQTKESLNEYQRNKLAFLEVPNLTTLIPGFFIEDVGLTKGLHYDTTKALFSEDFPAIDLSKAYSVTPKSFICSAIATFILKNSPPKGTYICCSEREYRRWELRRFSGLEAELVGEAKLEPAYPQNNYFALTEDDIIEACTKTRKLLE